MNEQMGMFLSGAVGEASPKKGRKVSLISVPFWLGCGRAGTEYGPESIIKAGLKRVIGNMGLELAGAHEVNCPRLAVSDASKVKHLPEVREMSRLVCEEVSRAVKSQSFPLVLGGDHSVAIGSMAGLSKHYSNLGVIWFDAHCDLNTEETSPTGNVHGMALAAALGKSQFKLTDIPGAGPLIKKENIVIIGVRDVDAGEKELIREEGIACFTMHEIDRMGIRAVVEKALEIAGRNTDGIHVSFDLDCLDPLEAAGVGTPVPGGLNYREAHFALELLAETGCVTSADIVEVNPMLDIDKRTSRLAVELAASLLGKCIL